MTVCSHCGREAAPKNLFCQYCGQKLTAQQEAAHQDASAPEYAEPARSTGEGYYATGPWMPAPSDDQVNGAAASVLAPSVPVATAAARARLVVRSTAASEGRISADEREFILDERDVAIGRSPSCDIALSGDQLASRRHALLRYKTDRFTLVDLGSSNGTYVNDMEIREETPLNDGDIIRIGGHEVLFSTSPASPRASLAGVRLSQPLPPAPLAATNPSIPAIDLAALESAAAAASGVDVMSEAPVAVEPVESVESADVEEVIAPPEAEVSSQAAGGATANEAPAVNFILSGSTSGDFAPPVSADHMLDALRTQLNEVTMALTERAAKDAATAARQRAALSEVRGQLTSALAAMPAPDDVSTGDLSELVIVARQAAENPRHLDYLTTLAARAGEIADALEARPASEPDATLRATIEGLLARIDELLT